MLAFSAFYGIGKESLLHQAFTCVRLPANAVPPV